MTRRRIKSEFFCINSIQFIRLKIKKKFLSLKSPLYDIFMSMKCTVYEMAYPLNVLSLNILSMICLWNILLMKKIYLEIRFHVFICRFQVINHLPDLFHFFSNKNIKKILYSIPIFMHDYFGNKYKIGSLQYYNFLNL